jgi:predicted transcriptional regulator
MQKNKDTWTIEELFNHLPTTIVGLAKASKINEVTLARIRDGQPARRDTVNKLLLAMSEIYKTDLSIDNVTGINWMRNKREEAAQLRKKASQEGQQ